MKLGGENYRQDDSANFRENLTEDSQQNHKTDHNQPTQPKNFNPAKEEIAQNDSSLDPHAAADHARSVHDYPQIDFAPNEYVIVDVERSKFGIFLIWLFAIFALTVILATIWLIATAGASLLNTNSASASTNLNLLIFASTAFCLLGGGLATWIFNSNHFIVTNERVFSRTQIAPFAHHTQILELEHVEDCSYKQSGIIQTMFGYGTLRLSTVGDEQTYSFTFVKNPAEHFKIINRIVQQVDEGEPTKYRRRNS